MFRSLHRDHKLASRDEWIKAGDWALEMRFFPHAFACFQLAAETGKHEDVLTRMDKTIDKITNVLEFVPKKLKNPIEDIRLSNPLDPAKWLQINNTILKNSINGLDPDELEAARFALSFASYCAIRSGHDDGSIDRVLKDLVDDVDLSNYQSPKLNLKELSDSKKAEPIKIVALGDNVTLGIQPDYEIKFQETYHYTWAKDLKFKNTLANNAISGAGVLDLALFLGRDAIYYKPDVALICFGINDIWLGPNIHLSYEVLLESCISILQEHDIQVVLVSPPNHIAAACPENLKPTQYSGEDLSIKPFAEACKRVAARTGCVFADAFANFSPIDGVRKNHFVNGFNQPNHEGQQLMRLALDAITVK